MLKQPQQQQKKKTHSKWELKKLIKKMEKQTKIKQRRVITHHYYK